jgi:hypothetical protein
MANGRYRVLHHPGTGRQQHADVPCPNNYTSPIPGIPRLRLASAPCPLRLASASASPLLLLRLFLVTPTPPALHPPPTPHSPLPRLRCSGVSRHNGPSSRPEPAQRSIEPAGFRSRRVGRVSVVFAVTAARIDADDPLSGLELGERPEPIPPSGWVTVSVKATALNHHDVWTLRGAGISADRLPVVLGCDAAGLDPDGNEVIVHAVIGDLDAGGGDETLDPRRSRTGSACHAATWWPSRPRCPSPRPPACRPPI